MHDVAVLYDVVFAFDIDFAGFAAGGFGTEGDVVVVLDDLCANESFLEVAVNDAGALGCLAAFEVGPGPHFGLTGGEVGFEVEQLVGGPYEAGHARLFEPYLVEEHLPLLIGLKLGDFRLYLGGHDEDFGIFAFHRFAHPLDVGIAVYGAGNTALYSALELAKIAQQVYLIQHNDLFRADEALIQRAKNEPKITLILGAKITELQTKNDRLSGLALDPTDDTVVPAELAVTGLFVSIGRAADTKLFAVELDEQKRIVVDQHMETSQPYLFAAGDVVAGLPQQIVTAAASGATAALAACQKLLLKR